MIFSLKQLITLPELIRLIILKSYVPILIKCSYNSTIIYGSIIRLFGRLFGNEAEILQILPRANHIVTNRESLIILSGQSVYMFGDRHAIYDSLYKLNLENIRFICASHIHFITITESNNVYAVGNNCNGQLGLGDQLCRNEPTKLLMNDIKSATCGHNFTILSTENNQLYGSGNNEYGQLGLGHNRNVCVFEKINLSDVATVSATVYSNIALSKFGIVYSWGGNNVGQLGLGDNVSYNSPQRIWLLNEKIISIATDYMHVLVLSDSGNVFSWGNNSSTQLGIGYSTGFKNRPQKLNLTNIISISCGQYHNFVVDVTGNMYSWGDNEHGQLGLGDKVYRTQPQLVKY